jgi:hypothetical protein
LRERDLAPLLAEFRSLSESERRPKLESAEAALPKRPVPRPPEGGLIIRGYCTYMKSGEQGRAERATQYYYKENPDAWAAETQSDMLWLTESEWRSLIPRELEPGARVEVSEAIRRRFFGTIGIEYLEGSVNALPVSESALIITVRRPLLDSRLDLRIEGFGRMGMPQSAASASDSHTRGCEVRVVGRIVYDARQRKIESFDLAGVGEAWGNKMEYTRREVRLPEPRWMYGIACELVTGQSPYDHIPPYNMLHYGGTGNYFAEK